MRNSAKAIIKRDDHILVIKKEDAQGAYYIFPGGGQEKFETLEETVRRECLEELDAAVDVHELICIREYIGQHHEFVEFDRDVHQIEFYFLCTISEEHVNGEPSQPDTDQIGMEWIPIQHIADYRLYPKALIQPIQNVTHHPVYLGDVN